MDLSRTDTLLQLHDDALGAGRWPELAGRDEDPALHALLDNHRCNIALWDAEDQARRRDRPDAYVVQCKRAIDRHNQQRNDAVERLDEALLQSLSLRPSTSARLHSETPGAIIDRLSILSLKIFHMGEQMRRTDATAEHLAACDAKLQRLVVQRADLAGCLAQLWTEIAEGTAYFKQYRQFKMYNDPALNPWLRAGVGGEKDAGPRPSPG